MASSATNSDPLCDFNCDSLATVPPHHLSQEDLISKWDLIITEAGQDIEAASEGIPPDDALIADRRWEIECLKKSISLYKAEIAWSAKPTRQSVSLLVFEHICKDYNTFINDPNKYITLVQDPLAKDTASFLFVFTSDNMDNLKECVTSLRPDAFEDSNELLRDLNTNSRIRFGKRKIRFLSAPHASLWVDDEKVAGCYLLSQRNWKTTKEHASHKRFESIYKAKYRCPNHNKLFDIELKRIYESSEPEGRPITQLVHNLRSDFRN